MGFVVEQEDRAWQEGRRMVADGGTRLTTIGERHPGGDRGGHIAGDW